EVDSNGAFDVDVVAESPCEHQFLDLQILDAHDLLQHEDAGVNRSFGKLELADVLLSDRDVLTAAGLARPAEHELPFPLPLDEPVAKPGRQRVTVLDSQKPGRLQYLRVQPLGHGIDEPRSADTYGRNAADDAAGHVLTDLHFLDCADRAAHSVLDLGALEGRTGRRGTGHQPSSRSHHHFAV